MCGIGGVFDVRGVTPHLGALRRATRAISHRGPDGEGFGVFDVSARRAVHVGLHGELPDAAGEATVALGHRRLAIIDLSAAGLQPMANEDRQLWLVFNGEIYNFVELRAELESAGHTFGSHTDSEVILHAYEEWGEACVHRFVGMWAFAILDLRERRLFCSRDRFGIKPFHYTWRAGRFAFGSEIKQLLEFGFVDRAADERVVHDFLRYEAVDAGARTFFDGVRRLPQGHNLRVPLDGSEPEVVCYYRPTVSPAGPMTTEEAAAEFARLLRQSVGLHLRSDVDVGSCLSGGLDSAAIVCLMQSILDDASGGRGARQHTFSAVFDEPEANEAEYAREVIRATGVEAHWTTPSPVDLLADLDRLVWHQEEPFGSTSIFAQWSVFKLIHEAGVKVVLDGQGADEQLGGYVSLAHPYFAELAARRQYVRLMRETLAHARLQGRPWRPLLPGRLGGAIRRLTRHASVAMSRPPSDWLASGFEDRIHPDSEFLEALQDRPYGERAHLSNALHQFTFRYNLPALLRYEDRNSMAFSVESRVPYLDHRLVEFAFSLPSSMKIRDGWTKRVMRDALRGVIPETIRQRARKMGFATPEATWQRDALRPLVSGALADERIRRYVDPDRARRFESAIHERGLLDFGPWRWVSLHLWMDRYGLA